MEDVHAVIAGGAVDGVMLGRLARDDPWFFSRVDSEIFGDADAFAGVSPLEARLRIVEQCAVAYSNRPERTHDQGFQRSSDEPSRWAPHRRRYAEYCAAEERGGHETSREMLLKPLNQLLDGLPEKQSFATLVRTPRASRPPLFADELHFAVESLRNDSGSVPPGAGRSAVRPVSKAPRGSWDRRSPRVRRDGNGSGRPRRNM